MTTRIFKIKQQASAEQVLWAQRVAQYLLEKRFDGTELNDLVFQVAQTISLEIKEELGATMALRIADREYTAAEEINQHSVEDQLVLLRHWYAREDHKLKNWQDSGEQYFRKILTAALGTELPEEFWLIHA